MSKPKARSRPTRTLATSQHSWLKPLMLLVGWLLVSGQVLSAQQPPEIGYVYPPCVQAGTTVDVVLGGYDFTPDMQFFVHEDRVKFEILGPPSKMLRPGPPYWFGPRTNNQPLSVPREILARITVGADVPPGVVRWQVANANGGSLMGELVIRPAGRTAEVTEELVRSAAGMLPKLPVALSGRLLKNEEVDHYQFQATQAGLVTCDVLPCGKYGAAVNVVVEIFDSAGKRVADAANVDGHGRTLAFTAVAGELYRMEVHELDYRGDRSALYHLTLAHAPRILAAVPAQGTRGKTQSVRLIGYGVATGAPEVETTTREITFPQDADEVFYDLETPYGTAAPYKLGVSDIPEQARPNAALDAPLRLQPPMAVTAALAHSTRPDEYIATLEKGVAWWIAVESAKHGTPLDVSLSVIGPDDKPVTNDDVNRTTDAGLLFRAREDGEHRIEVRDLSGQAVSPEAVYRLSITEPTSGFKLTIVEEIVTTVIGEDPVDTTQRLRPGTPGVMTVQLVREVGFLEPVTLHFSGIPEGVGLDAEVVIPERTNKLTLAVACAADAAANASVVKVHATSVKKDGQKVSDQTSLMICPVLQPRALVRPYYPDAGRTVHRGATYPAPVVIERTAGYEGEVRLEMTAVPDRVRQGIWGEPVTVPAGESQWDFPLQLPEWLQTDRTSRIMLNTVVRVPDGQGNLRYLLQRMDRRITMNVEGALLSLAAEQQELSVSAGETIEIPLRILRSPSLAVPVQLELIEPAANAPGFQAEPLNVEPQASQASLRVTAPAQPATAGEYELTLRATALRDGHPVVSQTTVVLIVKPS